MKVTGIKKSVGIFNRHIGHAKIMLDASTGEVWCDTFTSCNNYSQYHNNNIKVVCFKGTYLMESNWDLTSMKGVKNVVDMLISDENFDYIENPILTNEK